MYLLQLHFGLLKTYDQIGHAHEELASVVKRWNLFIQGRVDKGAQTIRAGQVFL